MRKIFFKILSVFSLICILIFNSNITGEVQDDNIKFENFQSFIKSSPRENSVLILEFNDWHHECIPGYAKYFLDLGFNVDVLLLKGSEDCLCLFENCGKINIYNFSFDEVVENKNNISKIMDKYKYIFLNSAEIYDKKLKKYLDFIVDKKSIIVTHSTNTIKRSKIKNIKNRIVTLGKFNVGNYVNPHYFGNIDMHHKNKKTNFIAVGNMYKECRNYDILIESVRNLKNKNKDFIVTLLGRGSTLNIPEDIKNYFNFLGRLSYKDMYEQVKNADFILMLLDPKNQSHLIYKTSKVSGNVQLSYGFTTPVIINKDFADFYGFNDKNSIIYEENLTNAMNEAINKTEEEYNDICYNLKTLSNSIFLESINNLKSIIENIN